MATAGALFAFACSTRETAVLMLLPLLVFAVTARLEDRSLPYAKPLLVFGVAFALASLPLLMQNLAVSGHALVPAQASLAFAQSGAIVPGVRADRLAGTLPNVVAFLGSHFGPVTLALAIAGLLAAVLHRQTPVLSLFLPGTLTYALFYAGYDRVVPRYLFAVDLFALPIAGVGAAALLALALRPVATRRRQRRLAEIALAAVLLAAAAVPLRRTFLAEGHFGLAHARALRRDFTKLLPPEARVIGEIPLGQVVGCFADQEAIDVRMIGRKGQLAPGLRERVRALADLPRPVYAASRSTRFRSFLESEFDLVPVVVLGSARYLVEQLLIDRVLPWSRRTTETHVEAPRPGDYVLALNVGALSKEPRSWARVLWDGAPLDERPLDGLNYYRVAAAGGPLSLALTSDRPVPAGIQAALLPLDQPLRLEFDGPQLLDFAGRFSDSFVGDARTRFPTITGQGSIDVPTVDPGGAFFVFVAELGIEEREAGHSTKLAIEAGGEPLYGVTLVQPETETRGEGRFEQEIVFWAGPSRIASDDTRLRWRLGGGDPAPVSVRSLTVHRYAARERLEIDVGSPWDAAFVDAGFHARESLEAGDRRWRSTGERARLRIFAWRGERPLRLSVHHFEGERPPGVPAADPRFRFNGHRLRDATTHRVPGRRLGRVTTSFLVPAAWVGEGINVLEIRATTWTPSGLGNSADSRRLGLMVDGVSVEPGP
ncbi:MAG: hypothetical protein ACRD3M_07760, partial [Thermoanaerobaculia bacterium]